MFRQMRYQTGEVPQAAEEMKKGEIPCLEVMGHDEFNAFAERLTAYGIQKSSKIPYDRSARDGVMEPEFEFRAAFHPADADRSLNMPDIMYIDVYFEAEIERTYDPVGEM